MAELFPKDKDTEWAQRNLEGKIQQLQAFKVRLKTVAASSLEFVMVFWVKIAIARNGKPKGIHPKQAYFRHWYLQAAEI